MLEANKLDRHALVWARTPLRTHAHDSFRVVGRSDSSWACRREGSSQSGHFIVLTDTPFLEQAECKICVAGTMKNGLELREARMQLELQAAADAERELYGDPEELT